MEQTNKKIVVTDADQQIRDYYENQAPSETEAYPNTSETIATTAQLRGKVDRMDRDSAKLSGGIPMCLSKESTRAPKRPEVRSPHRIRTSWMKSARPLESRTKILSR